MPPGQIVQFIVAVTSSLILASASFAAGEKVLFREDFDTLVEWKPLTFKKISRHTSYTIEKNGDVDSLRAESSASASALVYKASFNVYEHPAMRWRWKIGNIYMKGDATSKAGDDFPIRIYVMFEYDPEKARGFERIKYGIAKSRYGEYPPHSSLNYVWSSREHPESIITNPYTDRVRVVLLRKGAALVNTWQDEQVNIPDDYEKAFGRKPPERARIAVMNDSDNTGESSVSWIDYIEVFHEGGKQ